MTVDPVLQRAATLTADDLMLLADLERRSRAQGAAGRLEAAEELAALGDADEGVARVHLLVIQRADIIAARPDIPLEAQLLAASAIAEGCMAGAVGERLSRPARSYLARVWRRLLEEIGTPLTGQGGAGTVRR